jgi:hypothetical protein
LNEKIINTVKRTVNKGFNLVNLKIEERKKRTHTNYLLKCPVCKSEDVVYFEQNLRKISIMKKIMLLFRHEYHCRNCNSFIKAKDILKYRLQKGDEGFIDILKEENQENNIEETLRKKLQKGLDVVFGYKDFEKEELLNNIHGPKNKNKNEEIENKENEIKHKNDIDVIHKRKKTHILDQISKNAKRNNR